MHMSSCRSTKDLDGADEKSLGEHKIGTTKRGIGPCYQDKARARASVSRICSTRKSSV